MTALKERTKALRLGLQGFPAVNLERILKAKNVLLTGAIEYRGRY